MATKSTTHIEPHSNKSGKKLNLLRAAVLGANDGIVSVAGLVVGVAGATQPQAASYLRLALPV
jgi:VIT1/CCC1 family predicted Fe2+/Mn2+ transporter